MMQSQCLRSACVHKGMLKVHSRFLSVSCPSYLRRVTKHQPQEAKRQPQEAIRQPQSLSLELDDDEKQTASDRKIWTEPIKNLPYKNFEGKRYKIYNSVLHEKAKHEFLASLWVKKVARSKRKEKTKKEPELDDKLPICASMLLNSALTSASNDDNEVMNVEEEESHVSEKFPYSVYTKYQELSEEDCIQVVKLHDVKDNVQNVSSSAPVKYSGFEIRPRPKDEYDIETTAEEDFQNLISQRHSRYGRPDPNIHPSRIPCHGCGAKFHCQDEGLPGYIPSEMFVRASNNDLRSLLCQRCYFMREHNVALSVNVAPEEYVKLLSELRDKNALLVLIVDLTDFPCSIWPDLLSIVGSKRPMIVVGNKVDLLPRDKPGYLEYIKSGLANQLKIRGIDTGKNIKHVCLVSAKTGFGMESLITKMFQLWGTKGDVYLVGCTNVGKSSIFNALIQSDFCNSEAIDIIQRATVSPWPGTTLNLLKFPILRPTSARLHERVKRLIYQDKLERQERKLRKDLLIKTKRRNYETLIGHLGMTFFQPESAIYRHAGFSPFDIEANVAKPALVSDKMKVFHPKDPKFKDGRWCYDTPGSVSSEQIINLLTLEELKLTLPKSIMTPQTFLVNPKYTLFLAGLARIDYIEGPEMLLLTIFASRMLPITSLPTEIAERFHKKYFGTEVFKVPTGDPERLQSFPPLVGKDIEVTTIGYEKSVADIVLSSAGWVAVTAANMATVKIKAYTPDGKGCHVRQPALLPYAVTLRGKRLRYLPCYRNNKFCV